ncbi:cache domain-containing sensor histidine kinase [Gorillibacterium massiliense]|uniref:cache domain-containing sensor histidine kinase n=1 Tax=Gorillibacterium massiliense TaxID=1280390 RepID=UPI0004BBF7CB|nr:sensor histidine kinase [Gorillibacterium massiliense]
MLRTIAVKNRVATKLILGILLVILISTLSTSLYFYEVSTGVVKTNARSSSIQIAKQAADSLSYSFNVGSDMSDLLYNDVRVQSLIAQDSSSLTREQITDRDDDLTNTLNTAIYSSSFVRSAHILRESGKSWGSGTFSQPKRDRYSLSSFEWIREAEVADGKTVWAMLQYDPFSGPADDTQLVLPISRVMKDFTTLDNIGYLMVNLDGDAILAKIAQVRLGKTGLFFVTNSKGTVMIHPDMTMVGKTVDDGELYRHIVTPGETEFEFNRGKVPYYGVKMPLSNGWTMVGIVPVREITGQMEQLRNSLFLSAGLFALLAVIVGMLIAKKITQPIKELTRQMKTLETGDFNVRTSVRTKDEIGQLSHQFNRMTSRIEQLMVLVREEQAMKQEAELRAVIHRINPHFLFNTLNTLRWLVKFGDNDKAFAGLSALSLMLEFNMAKTGSMTTIEEELEVIRQYLIILQLRYNLSFHLHVEAGEDVRQFRIPRMLIQPIVENAIFHGIVPRGADGDINIRVVESPERITIILTDNGVGIDAAKLAELSPLNAAIAEGRVGIGLKHVQESLQLYFAPGSGIRLESRKGEGTIVTLQINKRDESR